MAITLCSRESQDALRSLAATGVNVPAVALVAEGDLGPLAAMELAVGLVPSSARASDIHSASPSGDRWSVDEVRDLIVQPAYLVPTSRCVVIVDRAEAMDQACSDSLLKLLEEPPSGALFVLCVGSYEDLATTVQSRIARVIKVEPAPVAARLGDLLDLGMDRTEAKDLLAACEGAHSVVAFVAEDLTRLPTVTAALSQELFSSAPAVSAHTLATALEALAQAILEAEGGKSNPTACRARARLLSRSLLRRWRRELAARLRDKEADIKEITSAAAALDELEEALWRYRPMHPALTHAMVTANG